MYEYQKRANTTNFIKLDRNNYIPPKHQRFRDIYINQSPTFYNQYRYDIENQFPNMHQVRYAYRQKRPYENYNDDRYENFNNSLKPFKSPNDYFFNEFNYMEKNKDGERKFTQGQGNSLTSPNSNKLNQVYYLNKSQNIESNSQDNKNKNALKFNLPSKYNSFKELNENKIYIKNPLINNNDKQKKEKIVKNRISVNTIAQKICNIVIQGEPKKRKDKKNKNKSEKSSENKSNEQNTKINQIHPQNLNLNKIKNKYEKYNQVENEENENEEIEEKEGNVGNENENYFEEKESHEEYEEEENTNNYYNNKNSQEKEGQYEYESNRQDEIEGEEEEDNNANDNIEEDQEIEEDEQFRENEDNNNTGKIKRNIYYQIQKKNEIELNPNPTKLKNEQLNIIKDDNIEIHGEKKLPILEINTESNIELIKQEHKPIIEIQKVQNYEQPRDFQRKSNKGKYFKISKNEENNVDIKQKYEKGEPIYQIEKIQNFKQQRAKERNSEIKRNKIKKYKISKLPDADLFIEKDALNEPILEIEKVNDFFNIKEKKNKKENNIFEIEQIEEANLILEKIELEPIIEIQRVNNIFQKRNEERKIPNKTRRYKLKISKQKENDVEIIKKPSIAIIKQENIEIKTKFINKKKKSDYKKLKKSIRNTFQYHGIKPKPNVINISKENRFVFKGKPKKSLKKTRNVIKQEIIHFYKSPLINEKAELSIEGNIQNIISPTDKKLEEKKIKTITLDNSVQTKNEIEIKHIIGVSPEKDEKNKEYNSNTFPNNIKNKEKENQSEADNKNDLIRISQIKGDKKYFNKKYISPRRMRQSSQGKSDENKNEENNRVSLNSVNAFSLTREEKSENNNSKANTNNNLYYSSSFRASKKEKNKNVDNNTLFISGKSSSSKQSNKNSGNKNDSTKNDMNRIIINSSNNSPNVLLNLEGSRIKAQQDNIKKLDLEQEVKKDEEKEEELLQTEPKQEENDNNLEEAISKTNEKNNEIEAKSFTFLDNYNNIYSQELSEYTKAYLNSYMSAARPELSDFSKQFLSSNDTNNFTTKPELSNITRAYLFSQNDTSNEK